MATSEISMGMVHAHALAGRPLPPGVALDSAGEPTTEPEAAKGGAIAPFGGAKGYGLGLGLELMVAALTASAIGTAVRGTLDETHPATKGDLFLLLAPATAPSALTEYLAEIRASGETTRVLVPGDRARMRRDERRTQGIALPDPLLHALHTLDSSAEASK
jgi:LDH2 family malate/lactate/ureidoglycolate dehydrogenase